MALAKKGSRKIIVDDIEYLYKVSKVKYKSNWREQDEELDDTFMKYARYNGIGQVMDITINLVIQLEEKPLSSFFIKINTIWVNGFMGPEQVTQIKPKLVSKIINKGLEDGWEPLSKDDYRLSLLEKHTKNKKPVLLQLSNMEVYVKNHLDS